MEHTQNYEDGDINEENQGGLLYQEEGSPEYIDNMEEGLIGVNYEDNNEEEGINEEKELIYNEDSGYQNVDKLFDEQSGESAFYEIQFRIFDKKQNKVRNKNSNYNIYL
jgi:hypothetical protein